MSSAEERKEVFAWFGAASYYAQCVEVELCIARMAMARGGAREPSEEEWDRIDNERRTMGGLMNLVKQSVTIEEEEGRILRMCLEQRNYLAHDFWYVRGHLLASSAGCQEGLEELKELCDLFKQGNAVAERISARLRAQVGISEAVVQRLQREFIARLQSGERQDAILKGQEAWLKRLSACLAEAKEREQE